MNRPSECTPCSLCGIAPNDMDMECDVKKCPRKLEVFLYKLRFDEEIKKAKVRDDRESKINKVLKK